MPLHIVVGAFAFAFGVRGRPILTPITVITASGGQIGLLCPRLISEHQRLLPQPRTHTASYRPATIPDYVTVSRKSDLYQCIFLVTAEDDADGLVFIWQFDK